MSSTDYGVGVAEFLGSMVLLLNGLGILKYLDLFDSFETIYRLNCPTGK